MTHLCGAQFLLWSDKTACIFVFFAAKAVISSYNSMMTNDAFCTMSEGVSHSFRHTLIVPWSYMPFLSYRWLHAGPRLVNRTQKNEINPFFMIPERNPCRFLDAFIGSVPFRHNGHHLELNTHIFCVCRTYAKKKTENNFISSGVFIFNIREIRIKGVPVCLFMLWNKKNTLKMFKQRVLAPTMFVCFTMGLFLPMIAFDGKRLTSKYRNAYSTCYHLICLSYLHQPVVRYSRMPFVECGVLKSN